MSDSISPSPSGAAWWRQDKAELVAALRERESVVRRAQAESYEILAEMQSRGPLAEFGYGNLEALQADVLNISRSDAKRRVRRALALHPTRGITGTTAALAPATAAAAAEGAVGVEHIDIVLDVLRRIPDEIPAEERHGYEKALVDYARVSTPASVAKLGREVLVRVDPDGTPPRRRGWSGRIGNSTPPGPAPDTSASAADSTARPAKPSKQPSPPCRNPAPPKTAPATPAHPVNATATPSPKSSTSSYAKTASPPKQAPAPP